MKTWQRGSVYALIFSIIISVIYGIVLIAIDIILERRGLPHMCFMFTESIECTFSEAIQTRLKFTSLLIIIFAPIVTFFGGLIGYIIDRLRIE